MKLLEAILSGRKKARSIVQPRRLSLLNLELEFRSTEEFFEQSSRPRSSDPTCLVDRYLGGYSMKIKKGTKKVTLFKFLLSKLIWDEADGLHLDEYLVLNHLWFDLSEIEDPSFVRKYGDWILTSFQLFTQLTGASDFPLKLSNDRKDREYLAEWLGPLALTPQSFFGMKGNRNIRDSFVISFRDSRLPIRIPPKRFVGVGYRDKGTRQKTSEDGTLHWTEYAQESGELESALERLGLESLNDPGSSSQEKKT